jgi:hypothetical protein
VSAVSVMREQFMTLALLDAEPGSEPFVSSSGSGVESCILHVCAWCVLVLRLLALRGVWRGLGLVSTVVPPRPTPHTHKSTFLVDAVVKPHLILAR